jgi:hypothetical protein
VSVEPTRIAEGLGQAMSQVLDAAEDAPPVEAVEAVTRLLGEVVGASEVSFLPDAFTCEAGVFTLSGWLKPAATVGGDTFDVDWHGDGDGAGDRDRESVAGADPTSAAD